MPFASWAIEAMTLRCLLTKYNQGVELRKLVRR